MDDKELQAIKERRARITPPPWEAEQDTDSSGHIVYLRAPAIHPAIIAAIRDEWSTDNLEQENNFVFLQHAPEDIDRLIEAYEVERDMGRQRVLDYASEERFLYMSAKADRLQSLLRRMTEKAVTLKDESFWDYRHMNIAVHRLQDLYAVVEEAQQELLKE